MKIMAVFPIILILSGCANLGPRIPFGAERLHLSTKFNESGDAGIDSMCSLYLKFDLSSADCRIKSATDEQSKEQLRIQRNELQNALLAESTARCIEFKDKLIRYSTRNVVGLESFSILLSAGAATVSGARLAESLAASAGAGNAVSSIWEDNYSSDLEVALAGIELGRTKVFKNIRDGQKRPLSQYSVSRAVNDALRYHAACSRADGKIAIDSAIEDAIDEAKK